MVGRAINERPIRMRFEDDVGATAACSVEYRRVAMLRAVVHVHGAALKEGRHRRKGEVWRALNRAKERGCTVVARHIHRDVKIDERLQHRSVAVVSGDPRRGQARAHEFQRDTRVLCFDEQVLDGEGVAGRRSLFFFG